jgi:hypothetical protein
MSEPSGLTDEVREILRAAGEPMTTAEIAARSGLAQSTSDVSKILYGLRIGGFVARTPDKRYRLIDPPPERPQRRRKTEVQRMPAVVEPATCPPAQPPAAEGLLAGNAERARATLEQYVSRIADPVLDALLRAAVDAQGALDAYRSRHDV